ncbi:hypothetical protein [Amycolatopsis magusensis]|uniref:hypothetical protein n=1 Tax=Amycolatopsis magusensis TaxID=882444 RepID=UPI00378DF038
MPDENLVGHWSEREVYPHDPEYSDLVFRADGTGWTYWCSWGQEFSVERFRWRESAGGILEVKREWALSGTWSLLDGVARHEVEDRDPLATSLTAAYRITGDPPTLELDRPLDANLGGTRFLLVARKADPALWHGIGLG